MLREWCEIDHVTLSTNHTLVPAYKWHDYHSLCVHGVQKATRPCVAGFGLINWSKQKIRTWDLCAISLLMDTEVMWTSVKHHSTKYREGGLFLGTNMTNLQSSFRSQRNQTKLMEMDKDSQQRPKRGWIWNQFFVLEEHIGPDPQYVGKVRLTNLLAVVFFFVCFYQQ